jgi:AGCS family alanine or glycine:cation symporter
MLGVFLDTIVICTCTAAIILMSGQFEPGSGVTGVELTQRALSSQGGGGNIFIAAAIFFFAFTSIVANYSYAETNLVFLEHNHGRPDAVPDVRAGHGDVRLRGRAADRVGHGGCSMGLMAIVNLVAILLLSGVAIKLAKDYNDQLAAGRADLRCQQIPELRSQLEEDLWDNPGRNKPVLQQIRGAMAPLFHG